MTKKKVLLIQPHSDDIVFSASKYLFERKKYKKVKILTVEHNLKRFEEDLAMCESLNIDFLILKTKVSSENFHKEYYQQHSKMDVDDCLKFCIEKIGNPKLLRLTTELDKILTKHQRMGYEIITCLGVGHPFHWLVNFLTTDYSDLHYRDFPHSYKRRNQDYFNFVTENEYDLDFNHFDKEQHDEKFKMVYEFYKSQRSLLFFEKRYIEKNLPEQFFKRK